MAFIRTTPPDAATGDLRSMYERQQRKFGYVPNYAKVFSERPDILALWADLLAGIRRHIEPRRFELVTFAAACELRNSYCLLAHGGWLREKLVSSDELRALADEERAGPVTEAERAMMALARKVVRDSSSVTQADIDGLRAHGLEDGEIFDVVATAAGRAFFVKLVDGLGGAPDPPLAERIDPALRERLVAGRPVALEAPERLGDATGAAPLRGA